jgi:hypothetical protein
MEPLTVTIASMLRRHPFTVPYVLVACCVVVLLGLHPW